MLQKINTNQSKTFYPNWDLKRPKNIPKLTMARYYCNASKQQRIQHKVTGTFLFYGLLICMQTILTRECLILQYIAADMIFW
jgi:hypothetical protein